MARFFNTAGPVNDRDHYCLPPLERFHLDEILLLIAQKKYFVLHAPRQTGKTSSLLVLQTYLNETGQYRCLYCNVEAAQAAREHVDRGIGTILGEVAERAHYEAGPQLLLQAFLQRILNGGGRIDREYGLGHQRTDLLVVWPYGEQVQRVVLELKIQHHALEYTLQQGLEQTWHDMDACGKNDWHLIIFNRDSAIPWDDKIFRREAQYHDHPIVVWGM